VSDTLVARFLAGLPYELTKAQRRALAVIVADMAGPFPMHRLLQGDVARARRWWHWPPCWPPCRAGTRVPSWCPPRCWPNSTSRPCAPCWATWRAPGHGGGAVRVELLTSRVKGKARAAVLEGLASGA